MLDLYRIPSVDLHNPKVLRNRRYDIDLQVHGETYTPIDQLAALIALMKDENPSEVLEIGTNTGCTARWMAKAMPGSIIHTLDLPVDWDGGGPPKTDQDLIESNRSAVGVAFRDDSSITNIRQHFGDSATFDFKAVCCPSFIFIDGSHSFDYVVSDTLRAMEASPGHGSIVWHDVSEGHAESVRAVVWLREVKGMDICRIASNMAWARF